MARVTGRRRVPQSRSQGGMSPVGHAHALAASPARMEAREGPDLAGLSLRACVPQENRAPSRHHCGAWDSPGFLNKFLV